MVKMMKNKAEDVCEDLLAVDKCENCLHLNSFLHWGLVALGPLHNLAGVGVGGGGGLATTLVVHVHQLGQVKPGSLHHLHLADVDIMQGVDTCNISLSMRI